MNVIEKQAQLDKLTEYSLLGFGWDGEEGTCPSFTDIERARKLLTAFQSEGLPIPNPMLSSNGDVGLYLDEAGLYVDIGIEADDKISYFAKDKSGLKIGVDDVSIVDGLPKDLIAFIKEALAMSETTAKEFPCNVCNQGMLVDRMRLTDFIHNGYTEYLPFHYCECNHCQTTATTPRQSTANKMTVVEFKDRVGKLPTKKYEDCPICEDGNLIAKMAFSLREYRGVVRKVPLHYSECDNCKSETATAAQARENLRVWNSCTSDVDGLLFLLYTKEFSEERIKRYRRRRTGGLCGFSYRHLRRYRSHLNDERHLRLTRSKDRITLAIVVSGRFSHGYESRLKSRF